MLGESCTTPKCRTLPKCRNSPEMSQFSPEMSQPFSPEMSLHFKVFYAECHKKFALVFLYVMLLS